MRSLLIRYATNPKNKRELFIFKESVERLNLAIKDKKMCILLSMIIEKLR